MRAGAAEKLRFSTGPYSFERELRLIPNLYINPFFFRAYETPACLLLTIVNTLFNAAF